MLSYRADVSEHPLCVSKHNSVPSPASSSRIPLGPSFLVALSRPLPCLAGFLHASNLKCCLGKPWVCLAHILLSTCSSFPLSFGPVFTQPSQIPLSKSLSTCTGQGSSCGAREASSGNTSAQERDLLSEAQTGPEQLVTEWRGPDSQSSIRLASLKQVTLFGGGGKAGLLD